MKIIDGKKIAKKIRTDLKKKISKLKRKPTLAVILVGYDKSSELYVSIKKKAAEELGINFRLYKMKNKIRELKIMELISELNRDENTDAILVQLPLPKTINNRKIIAAIDPSKDADGFHPDNQKSMISGNAKAHPVFPEAIIRLLKSVPKSDLKKAKSAIVIANSKTFGEMIKLMLRNEKINSEYILAKHFKSQLKKIKKADIVISARGQAGSIKGNMLKSGAIVIDGGISKKGKNVVGDVEAESTRKTSCYLSPVPGGVGPVTVALLMENVWRLATSNKK